VSLYAVMFPGVSRTRPQQTSEIGDNCPRKPTIVSLELKATAVRGDRAEVVDIDKSRQCRRKQRNRSISPLYLDASAEVRSSKSSSETKITSYKSVSTDEFMSSVTSVSHDNDDGAGLLLRQTHSFQPVANSAASPVRMSNRKTGLAHLPPLHDADGSECRVVDANDDTPLSKSEGAVRPLEVCALRQNPDIVLTATRVQFHQQQSTIGVGNEISKTTKSVSVVTDGTNDAVKLDVPLSLSLPDSDDGDDEDDDDNQETTEYYHSGSADKTSSGGRVGCSMSGIMEDSCPILSVRIEFGKSQAKQKDAENDTPRTTKQVASRSNSDDGSGRRRQAGRMTHKTKNAKTTSKPILTSKSIRQQPPKYLSNRTFNVMLNKRAFNK